MQWGSPEWPFRSALGDITIGYGSFGSWSPNDPDNLDQLRSEKARRGAWGRGFDSRHLHCLLCGRLSDGDGRPGLLRDAAANIDARGRRRTARTRRRRHRCQFSHRRNRPDASAAHRLQDRSTATPGRSPS